MDRFISVNFVAPLRRMFAAHDSATSIPILMYHSITDDPEPGVRGYYRLNTPPARFREHLQILKDESFAVIDLSTAANLLVGRVAPRAPGAADAGPLSSVLRPPAPQSAVRTSRYAVITFDDGFRDFYTCAAPALADFGFTATNFIISGFVGREFKGRPCMSWSELRESRSSGLSVGSHTVNHPKLWELDHAGLQRELTDSRQAIAAELGETADTFAHPYAFPAADPDYVNRFTCAAEETGYQVGVTTTLGCARPGDHPLRLKRLPVNGADDPQLFRAKLCGAYDWLAIPQALVKRLKRLRAS